MEKAWTDLGIGVRLRTKDGDHTSDPVEGSPTVDSDLPEYGLSRLDKLFIGLYGFVVIVVVLVSIKLTLPDDTISSSSATGAIRFMALPIYVLLIWGLWRGMILLFGIALEQGVVFHVSRKADSARARYQSNTIAPPSFGDLRRMIPKPNARTKAITQRMFERILNDAEDYIYDRREAVVRPYKDELDDLFRPVQSLQTVALRIGILGTFVGLILAIQQLVVRFDGGLDAFAVISATEESVTVEETLKPFLNLSGDLFAALHVSFGTSVAGLVVSILLVFFGMYLQRRQHLLFRTMDETAGSLMSLARRATYKEKGLLSSFAQMKAGMDSLERKVHHEMGTAAQALEAMGEHVKAQTGEICQGMSTLSDYRSAWTEFLADIKGQQEQATAVSEEHRKALETNIGAFLNKLDDREQQFLKKLSETRDLLATGQLSREISHSISNAGADLTGAIRIHVDGISNDLLASGRRLEQAMSASADTIKTQLDAMRMSNDTLSGTLETLSPTIQSVSRQMEATDRHMSVLYQLKLNLESTFERLQNAQLAFQANIEQSVERLQDIPLDQRLERKFINATRSATAVVNDSLQRVAGQLARLNSSVASVTESAKHLNRMASGRWFRVAYRVVLGIGILGGLSLVVLAITGMVALQGL